VVLAAIAAGLALVALSVHAATLAARRRSGRAEIEERLRRYAG